MNNASTDPAEAVSALPALQDALSAEHAAVYGYGLLGAYLSGKRRQEALAAWNDHREARDKLQTLVRSLHETPVPAAPDYEVPRRFSKTPGTDTAIRFATDLEERVGAAYAAVVATGTADLRRLGATAMRECAVRATGWRGSGVPFPGLPDAGPPAESGR